MFGWLSAVKNYIVLGAFVGVLAVVGVQSVRLAGARADLSAEQLARERETAERNKVALMDAVRTSERVAGHAARQMEISDELAQANLRRVAAERSNGELGNRLRAAVAAAARRGQEADAGGAAAQHPVDLGLFLSGVDGAGSLLARSADVVEQARSVIRRRDDEVAALMLVIKNDRELCRPE